MRFVNCFPLKLYISVALYCRTGDASQTHIIGVHSDEERGDYGYTHDLQEEEEIHLNKSKNTIASPEDEDFMSAFDKVMAESLQVFFRIICC